MNDIFDANQLPGRRLSVRKMIALHQCMSIDEAICAVKRDMAMQLAIKILEGGPFFWERGDKMAQCLMLEYGADCIVLTADEYTTLKREAFKDGVNHAHGFMAMPNAGIKACREAASP